MTAVNKRQKLVNEMESLASGSSLEKAGIIKSLLVNVPKDQIRTSIFILGVSVPGIFLYFLGKRHPAIDVLAKHFAKIAGLATTKQNMERFASQSRRTLENWGAINTGSSVNRTSGIADYTNHYFSALQKKAGMILAEQPNFARSNSQRTLELLIIHFADAYRNLPNKANILAGALIQNYKEMVEVSPQDTLIRAVLMAYQPFKDESEATEVYKKIETLDPRCLSTPSLSRGYKKLINRWVQVDNECLIYSIHRLPTN